MSTEKAKQEGAEALLREKDALDKMRVNNESLQDFMVAGLTEECSRIAITAIAKNKVRNIKINY